MIFNGNLSIKCLSGETTTPHISLTNFQYLFLKISISLSVNWQIKSGNLVDFPIKAGISFTKHEIIICSSLGINFPEDERICSVKVVPDRGNPTINTGDCCLIRPSFDDDPIHSLSRSA